MKNEAFSRNALGLMAAVTTFGNYDRKELVRRCLKRTVRQANTRTVLAVLDEMYAEQENYNAS